MTLQIRPVQPPDLAPYLNLLRQAGLDALPPSVDPVRVQIQLLAEVDGRMVGAALVHSTPARVDGHLDAALAVDVPFRRQGIGRAMAATLIGALHHHPHTTLHAKVSDQEPGGRRWAEQLGFVEHAHTFESLLNVNHVPLAELVAARTALRHQGYGVVQVRDAKDPQWEKVYDLVTELLKDEPAMQSEMLPPFRQFAGTFLKSPHLDATFVLAQGDEWVALSGLQRNSPEAAYTWMTGVKRSHRGQGLARSIKLLTVDYARSAGIQTMCTANDSRNGPMIAVNRGLGYRPLPGHLQLQLTLENA